MNFKIFDNISVGNGNHFIYQAYPSNAFDTSESAFQRLWNMHPIEFSTVKIFGKTVPTPRWSQTYGRDYCYSGTHHKSLLIPKVLMPFLCWSQENINTELDGLLVNWYDGKLDHYIGKYRDDEVDMKVGKSVVTISLGEECIFRFRSYSKKGGRFQDFKINLLMIYLIQFQNYIKH